MLENLHIRNMAVVAELDVDFGPGLNVVTGETGAGKSLILGALQLLLGERASPTVIRQGAAQCEISAVARLARLSRPLAKQVSAFLDEQGIAPGEDGELLLRRVISPSGTRNFVNATPVALQLLKQLGDWLVDIHGPNDHQSLLQPRCQLALLDGFADLDGALGECGAAWTALEEARTRLAAAQQATLSPQEEEFTRFQMAEIEGAQLEPGEDDELGARHARVAHRRGILEAGSQCRQGLTDADNAVVEQLRTQVRLLDTIEAVDAEHGAEFRGRLERIIESVDELSADLAHYCDALDLDEGELARLEERLGVIQKLKRKYGPTLADVLRSAESCRQRLAAVEQREQQVAALTAECGARAATHGRICAQLRAARQVAATKLAAEITAKLQKLGFAQGTFEIRFAESAAGPRGADQIEFCFAPNPGESLLPLRQIASSGEIARVMLAVKTILSHADQVPLLVFDEVDANIGGRVAVKVADELAAIARRHQVLCITHLPQIAAAGVRHYRVSKNYRDGRTHTAIDVLDAAGREEEITRMLGAEKGSAAARDHAREMLARGKG